MASLEVKSNSAHEKKKFLKCEKCNKKFISENRLKWHFATVHEGNKPYQCLHCTNNFSLKRSLKKHIISVHDGGPFKCSECSDRFYNKAQFKTHYLAHLYDKHFIDLPDEVLLKIFTYLNIEDLAQCAQVSIRMRNICKDESLWERINLKKNIGRRNIESNFQNMYQKIPTSFINYILDNGCKYLNICQSELVDGISLPKTSQLRYLAFARLYGARTNQAVEEITSTTYCLEKFSIAGQFWGSLLKNVIKNVCLKNSKTLTVLRLQIRELTFESIENIVKCTELKELSLAHHSEDSSVAYCKDIYTSGHSLSYLVQNISPAIKKISFEGKINFRNEHVQMLLSRCKKLEELSLRNTSITLIPLTAILENCLDLVKLDLSGNVLNDNDPQYFEKKLELLRSLPKLKVLKFIGPVKKRNKYNKKDWTTIDPNPMYIADPHEIEFAEDGLWEIKAKPIAFRNNMWNTGSDSE